MTPVPTLAVHHRGDRLDAEWRIMHPDSPEGVFHRLDGPARMVRYSNGGSSRNWYRNGVRYRDSGPRRVYADEYTTSIEWSPQHHFDGPAATYEDGWMSWSCRNSPVAHISAQPDEVGA